MAATTSTPRPLWTADQLAERLRVDRHRAYALIREHRVPGVVRIGRQVRVDPDAVEDWIQSGGTTDS